jgi:hypothetical protein
MLFMRLMLLARPNTTHEIDVADAARLTKLVTKLTLHVDYDDTLLELN